MNQHQITLIQSHHTYYDEFSHAYQTMSSFTKLLFMNRIPKLVDCEIEADVEWVVHDTNVCN